EEIMCVPWHGSQRTACRSQILHSTMWDSGGQDVGLDTLALPWVLPSLQQAARAGHRRDRNGCRRCGCSITHLKSCSQRCYGTVLSVTPAPSSVSFG
ncbi:hypothetical protein STEG23_008990, partial [Scotinomys teguina]